jgi:hypothetical protein
MEPFPGVASKKEILVSRSGGKYNNLDEKENLDPSLPLLQRGARIRPGLLSQPDLPGTVGDRSGA